MIETFDLLEKFQPIVTAISKSGTTLSFCRFSSRAFLHGKKIRKKRAAERMQRPMKKRSS